MIRPLQASDRAVAASLLRQARALNLYLLGNLYTVGLESDFCQFWGDFDAAGRLRAVLNRYMRGWALYGRADADWEGCGRLLDAHPLAAERLQDNPGGIDSFLPYLARYRARAVLDEELMCLPAHAFRPQPAAAGITVRRATQADRDDLVARYGAAGEMARTPAAVDRPLRDNRIWLAAQQGQIVAVALTNAELADLAMVGGVYTVPQRRGEGLSGAVCSGLCAELLAEGKTPVLYWINPAAGLVYRRLGFEPMGRWRSIYLEPILLVRPAQRL